MVRYWRVGQSHLPVSSWHFHLSDFFGHFTISLGNELILEIVPIFAWSVTSHQDLNDIDDGKPPFTIMQDFSYMLAIKNSQFS